MKKFIGLLALIVALPSAADWHLDKQVSTVNFVTIKKEHIAENHRFNKVQATVKEKSNTVKLLIDLTSVDTNIEIRDQRMKEHLFNVSAFPHATFIASIDVQKINSLAANASTEMMISGKISLHGQQQDTSVKVLVTKLANDEFLVTSMQSMLIKAQDFALVAGVNKLRELAQLPSITLTVPVNFVLKFVKQ